MADKTLTIKLETTGADQAAAQIDRTAQSVEGMAKAQQQAAFSSSQLGEADAKRIASGESTEDLSARIARLKERGQALEQEAESVHKLAEETETASKARNLLETAAKGVAMATAAREALEGLRTIAESIDLSELSKIDPDAVRNIQTMKESIEMMQSPVGWLSNAWERMFNNGRTASESAAEIAQELEAAQKVHNDHMRDILDRGVQTADAMKRLAAEIASANRVMDAKDSADAAADRRSDARRIREGADPYEVEKEAAEREAKRNIDRMEREQKAREAAAEEANRNADQKAENADRLANLPGFTPEEKSAAVDEAKKADQAARDAAKAAADQRAITEQRIREERERAEARKEAAQAAQDARQAEMQRKHDEDNFRMEDEARRKREQDDLGGALGSAERRARTGAERAADVFGRGADRSNSRAVSEAMEEISRRLADGTDTKEIEQLSKMFERATKGMGGATIEALKSMLAEQLRQQRDIETIKSQIKNLRNGK